MANMKSLTSIYEGLRQHRAVVAFAKEAGVSREWLRQVLSGEQDDPDLVLKAAKKWRDLEEERSNTLSTADQIAQEALQMSLAAA